LLQASNADRCNSQKDSVSPSATFRRFVQTTEDTIVRFSASGGKSFYTVNHKKRDILFLTITLANLNRFLVFISY